MAPTVDFGAFDGNVSADLPTSGPGIAAPPDDPFSSTAATAPLAAVRPANQYAGKTSPSHSFIDWVKGHRLITAIAVLNLLGLVVGALFSDGLKMMLFMIPAGCVVVGLLLIPRQNVIDRVMSRFGGAAAGAGAGGILLVAGGLCIRIILRGTRRMNQRADVDSSLFSNPSAAISLIVGMVVIVALGGLFLYCWKRFGLAKVSGVSYTAMLTFGLLSVTATGLDRAKQDRDFEAFVEESKQRAENNLPMNNGFGGDPAGGSPMQARSQGRFSNSGQPGNSRPGFSASRSPIAGGIEVVITHRIGSNLSNEFEQLAKDARITRSTRRTTGGQTTMTFGTSLSVKELANKIKFGQITQVDEGAKRITVNAVPE